jgi:hypothetical protein
MSHRKFAAMTGSLLARKGEACPSAEPQFVMPDIWRRPVEPPAAASGPAPEIEREPDAPPSFAAKPVQAPHKIAMRLTEAQHLRLRVAAAQLQVTRQALLAAALDHYLTTVCASGRPGCACLRSGGGCGCPA